MSAKCHFSDSCTAAKAPYWITSSACAGNAAHRLSRRPRRGTCAHHRVERLDRDARHEACSTRSRATSSTKPADRRTARACTATKCGKAAAHLQGSDCGGFEARVTFRDHSSVCRPLGNWNSGGRARPTGLPIRILQLSPAAHLYLSPDDTVSTISASRSRAFGVLFVERESVCK
jgi:hypothetical protein